MVSAFGYSATYHSEFLLEFPASSLILLFPTMKQVEAFSVQMSKEDRRNSCMVFISLANVFFVTVYLKCVKILSS